MKILYADCFSGISGDMFLAALFDLGLSEQTVRQELSRLALAGYEMGITSGLSGNMRTTRVEITAHDPQPCRTWPLVRDLIEKSGISPAATEKARAIFSALAEAEARVHGCTLDEVHLHEVGAVDSIIDIVGAAIGITELGVERVICSPLPLARGWIECQHGMIPLPAPAVFELLREVPVYGIDLDMELVTPTGAALVKTLAHSFGPFPPMQVVRVGYGAGTCQRPDQRPNLLRLVLGESRETTEAQEVEVIETHLDDWSPEGFPFLSEQLFSLGALDVVIIPIQMKKGRPGFLLRVITDFTSALEIRRAILTETTAIGLRFRKESRWTLPRRIGLIDTPWGPVQVKRVETPKGLVLYPEYEDCCRVAKEYRLSLKEVYAEVYRHRPEEVRFL